MTAVKYKQLMVNTWILGVDNIVVNIPFICLKCDRCSQYEHPIGERKVTGEYECPGYPRFEEIQDALLRGYKLAYSPGWFELPDDEYALNCDLWDFKDKYGLDVTRYGSAFGTPTYPSLSKWKPLLKKFAKTNPSNEEVELFCRVNMTEAGRHLTPSDLPKPIQ